jgi:hypothetical protein
MMQMNDCSKPDSYAPTHPRRAGTWAAVLCVLALLLATASPALARGDTRSGTQALPHKALLPLVLIDVTQSNDIPFGVEFLRINNPLVVRATQAGASWARVPLPWSQIEPSNTIPDSYQWPDYLDPHLAELSRRNIKVILTFGNNPRWAATYSGGPVDRVDISELVQFMQAAVAYYGAEPFNVKYWELYNEPDNGSVVHSEAGQLGYFGKEPKAYVALLRAVYGPMKAVDPEAQIVFGGIAYDNWTDTGGPFVKDFLDRVLQQGGGNYFDVMNFHYFPRFRQVWAPYGQGIIGKAEYLRSKLNDYGVSKPIICTEAGLSSNPTDGGSTEQQSRYVPQLFARSMAARLQTTIWHHLIDDADVSSQKFGLLNPDRSPKPAFYAYQTFAHQLSSAYYLRSITSERGDSDQLEGYEFGLRYQPSRLIVAWTNDYSSQALVLQTDQVVVVDKLGGEATVYDGDDGLVDGRISVDIGPSPVYIQFKPGGLAAMEH